MTDLITALSTFCTFCIAQLTSFAGFFTSTVIGQFILGIVLVSIVLDMILKLLKRGN